MGKTNLRRQTNQFNNMVSGRNLASVPQKMRIEYTQQKRTQIAEIFGVKNEVLEARLGEGLQSFIQRLINAHRLINENTDTKKPIKGIFNGIVLTVDEGVTADQLMKQFDTQMEESAAKYKASPEYKLQQEKDEKEVQNLQKKCDEYIKELDTLDFTNYEAVLDWFCKYQVPSDRIGVDKHKDVVLKTFHDHGFKNRENTGKDFNAEDEVNVARYLIGQGLSTLERASVHPMIIDYTEDWKKKFGKVTA